MALAKEKELKHIDVINTEVAKARGEYVEPEPDPEAEKPKPPPPPRKKLRLHAIETPPDSDESDSEHSTGSGSGSNSGSSSSSDFETPRTLHDRVYKEQEALKDCSGILKWVLPFLAPFEHSQLTIAPELGQRQILLIAETRSAVIIQRLWRTRVAFKKARDEILRRVQARREAERQRIALENYSITRISNCYRCLIARRILARRKCCRKLAKKLAVDVCDVVAINTKHERLWNQHKGFLGQVSELHTSLIQRAPHS